MSGPTRRVCNLETGETFPSIADAARAIGVCPQSFHRAVLANTSTFGHWEVIDPPRVGMPVRCVETGQTFPSATAAGRTLGTSSYMVLKSARKNRSIYTAKGKLQFELL